jgi:hypothetical protein
MKKTFGNGPMDLYDNIFDLEVDVAASTAKAATHAVGVRQDGQIEVAAAYLKEDTPFDVGVKTASIATKRTSHAFGIHQDGQIHDAAGFIMDLQPDPQYPVMIKKPRKESPLDVAIRQQDTLMEERRLESVREEVDRLAVANSNPAAYDNFHRLLLLGSSTTSMQTNGIAIGLSSVLERLGYNGLSSAQIAFVDKYVGLRGSEMVVNAVVPNPRSFADQNELRSKFFRLAGTLERFAALHRAEQRSLAHWWRVLIESNKEHLLPNWARVDVRKQSTTATLYYGSVNDVQVYVPIMDGQEERVPLNWIRTDGIRMLDSRARFEAPNGRYFDKRELAGLSLGLPVSGKSRISPSMFEHIVDTNLRSLYSSMEYDSFMNNPIVGMYDEEEYALLTEPYQIK